MPTVSGSENKTIAGFMFNWVKDNCNLPTDFTYNFNFTSTGSSISFVPEKSIGIYEWDVCGNYEAEFPFSIIIGVSATDDASRMKPYIIFDTIVEKLDEVTAKIWDYNSGFSINIDSTKTVLKIEQISTPVVIRQGEDNSIDVQSLFKLYYEKEVH